VGQTKRRLMDRMREHFLTIKKSDPYSPLGGHFNSPKHNGLDHVQIHVLEFIPFSPETERAKSARDSIELKWIHHLSTVLPFRLNSMD
jgi:hypothetical protein